MAKQRKRAARRANAELAPSDPSPRELALMAEIAEAPDDDGPRLVYADLVAEQGDVARAELIALQIARAKSGTAPSEHELRLVAKHASTWIAPIHPVLAPGGWTFERGFLDACVFNPRAGATVPVAGHVLWSTVRRVALEGGDPSPILVHPIMRSLRVVAVRVGLSLDTLLASDAPIEELSVRHASVHARGEYLRELVELRGLPRLRRIAIAGADPRAVAGLWKGGLDRAGMQLAFVVNMNELAIWWMQLARLALPARARVVLESPSSASSVDLGDRTVTVTVSRTRPAEGIWEVGVALGLGPDWPTGYAPIARAQRLVVGALRRIVIRAPTEYRLGELALGVGRETLPMFAAIEGHARNLGLELVVERVPDPTRLDDR